MLEAPSLAFCLDQLKGKADFLSIGTNDLMQYFFAADRGNARVADRYDLLSAPALRFLKTIREQADAAELPLSICGEAAGRPLEAMALIGLGFRSLSMPATGIGLVKAMIRSMDAKATADMIDGVLSDSRASLRGALSAYAREAGITLN